MLLAVAVLVPGVASAAAEGASASSILWQALNLALLIGVLAFFARKPLKRFFAERRETIQGNLKAAADLLEQAEGQLSQWEDRMAQLDREVEEVRATARERAEAERARILEEARASAERIRTDAHAAVDQELRRSKEALRAEAADLAMQLAGRMLSEQVTDDDRARLVDDFIQRVEASGPARETGS